MQLPVEKQNFEKKPLTKKLSRMEADKPFLFIRYDVTKRALKCLESITGAILSLYAWKLCHGKAMDDEDITGYSKVSKVKLICAFIVFYTFRRRNLKTIVVCKAVCTNFI